MRKNQPTKPGPLAEIREDALNKSIEQEFYFEGHRPVTKEEKASIIKGAYLGPVYEECVFSGTVNDFLEEYSWAFGGSGNRILKTKE